MKLKAWQKPEEHDEVRYYRLSEKEDGSLLLVEVNENGDSLSGIVMLTPKLTLKRCPHLFEVLRYPVNENGQIQIEE